MLGRTTGLSLGQSLHEEQQQASPSASLAAAAAAVHQVVQSGRQACPPQAAKVGRSFQSEVHKDCTAAAAAAVPGRRKGWLLPGCRKDWRRRRRLAAGSAHRTGLFAPGACIVHSGRQAGRCQPWPQLGCTAAAAAVEAEHCMRCTAAAGAGHRTDCLAVRHCKDCLAAEAAAAGTALVLAVDCTRWADPRAAPTLRRTTLAAGVELRPPPVLGRAPAPQRRRLQPA